MAKSDTKKTTTSKKSDTLRLRTFTIHTDKGLVSVEANSVKEAVAKAKEKK